MHHTAPLLQRILLYLSFALLLPLSSLQAEESFLFRNEPASDSQNVFGVFYIHSLEFLGGAGWPLKQPKAEGFVTENLTPLKLLRWYDNQSDPLVERETLHYLVQTPSLRIQSGRTDLIFGTSLFSWVQFYVGMAASRIHLQNSYDTGHLLYESALFLTNRSNLFSPARNERDLLETLSMSLPRQQRSFTVPFPSMGVRFRYRNRVVEPYLDITIPLPGSPLLDSRGAGSISTGIKVLPTFVMPILLEVYVAGWTYPKVKGYWEKQSATHGEKGFRAGIALRLY